MNWSEWQLLEIIDGALFARILSCFDCLRTDIHLSKEIIVFQGMILFVLICLHLKIQRGSKWLSCALFLGAAAQTECKWTVN